MRKILGRLSGLVLGLALVLAPGAAPAAVAPLSAQPVAVRTMAAPELGIAPARLLVQLLLEQRVLRLTNRHRVAKGCAPLRSNSLLRRSSRGHSVTMARHEEMSHRLPGEPRFTTRITRAGYTSWNLVAENVARGFDSPEAVVRAWMASPSHRRNMLDCRLRDLGVGVVLSGGQLWWTQNFGRR